jgi:hypothetical protein
MQLMVQQLGGKVERAERAEYGKAALSIDDPTDLLTNVEDGSIAWMSHGDSCKELPEGFSILAHTDNTDCAAIAHHSRKFFGVQFHPEVVHSVGGIALIRNFVYHVCGCEPTWTTEAFVEEAIKEIRGQEIPQVDDTQIDLSLTAFIPADYIPDLDQKMSAYRAVASAQSKRELTEIAADWNDRYGAMPPAATQLLRVMELKQVAKSLGFSRIKPEGKQHVVLETPMEEPAWNLLRENLPSHLQTRFVYTPNKVTVRGLGALKADLQLENLLDYLSRMKGGLPETAIA